MNTAYVSVLTNALVKASLREQFVVDF